MIIFPTNTTALPSAPPLSSAWRPPLFVKIFVLRFSFARIKIVKKKVRMVFEEEGGVRLYGGGQKNNYNTSSISN